MAEIVLRIKANEGGDILTSFSADQIVNNVSTPIGGSTSANNGVNGKSWATGYLSLADGYLGGQDSNLQSEVNKYNGFMFGATDVSGNYNVTITITGSNLDKIKVVGDKAANQFPTTAILDEGTADEITLYSDDPSWVIVFAQGKSSHTVKFTKWNRANYNACFTTFGLFVENLDLDRAWIDNITSLTQSSSDATAIQYNVLSNSGSVALRDLDGEFKDYIEDGVVPNSNLPLELYVNGKKAQGHVTVDSSYDNVTKILNFELGDSLRDKIETSANLIPSVTDNVTLYTAFKDIAIAGGIAQNETEFKNMLSQKIVYGENIFDTVESYLKLIVIPKYYLKKSSYREIIEMFLQLGQLTAYEDNNGKLKISSNRPKMSNQETIITLPKKLQYSDPKTDIIIKNKYTEVSVPVQNIQVVKKDIYDFNTINITGSNTTPSPSPDIINSISFGIAAFNSSNTYKKGDKVFGNVLTEFLYDDMEHIGEMVTYSIYTYINNSTSTGETLPDLNESGNEYWQKTSSIAYRNSSAGDTIDSNGNYVRGRYIYLSDGIFWKDIEDPFYASLDNFSIRDGQREITSLDRYPTYQGNTNPTFVIAPNVGVGIEVYIKVGQVGVTATEYLNSSVSLNFFVDSISSTTENIISGEKGLLYEFPENYLLQADATFNGTTNLHSIIANNILSDYSDGIRSGSVTIALGDLYDTNGDKVKDWSQGDMLDIGDIIRIDDDNEGHTNITYPNGDPIYFRVVGRRFRYAGVPMLDLELQETKL